MPDTLKNLETQWIPQPRSAWLEDIDSMIEGYPFEKKRREALGLDQPEPYDSRGDDEESIEFLAAHFGDKLVGWLELHPDSATSDVLSSPVLLAQNELVQRNRDDVRGHLIESLRERYPEAIIQFEHPSQNRTARNFLLSQPDIQPRSTYYRMGLEVTDDTRWSKPGTFQTNTEIGSSFLNKLDFSDRELQRLAPVSLPDNQIYEYLHSLVDEVHDSGNGRVLGIEDSGTALGLAFVTKKQRRLSTDKPLLFEAQLLGNERNGSLITSLLELIAAPLRKHPEPTHLEIRLDDDLEKLFTFLKEQGFSPVTKRMTFERKPVNPQNLQ